MAKATREVILGLIDGAAEQAGRHYEVYNLGLVNAFARAIDTPLVAEPRTKLQIENAANTGQVGLLTAFNDLIPDTVEKLCGLAIEHANRFLPDEERAKLMELVKTAENEAVGRVMMTSLIDQDTTIKAWRELAFQVRAKVAAGWSLTGAAMMMRAGRTANLKFKQLDRAGRAWDSALYAKTTLRSLLLTTYVESYLYAAAARPVDVALVDHDDGHKNNHLMFSINGATPGMPTFEEIREDVFHPNSRALVSHG